MGTDKESSIKSVSADLMAGKPEEAGNPQNARENAANPWNVLVCADLGYAGTGQEPVSSANIDEMLKSHEVVLRGNVEIDGSPVFVEYPVTAFTDLGSKKLRGRLEEALGLRSLRTLLEQVPGGQCTAADAARAIASLPAGTPLRDKAAAALAANSVAGSDAAPATDTGSPQNSSVNRILGALDVEDTGTASEKNESPVDRLASAASADAAIDAESSSKVRALLATMDTWMDKATEALAATSFFSNAKSSWFALRHFVKLAGRAEEVTISVCSATVDSAPELLASVLQNAAGSGRGFDIVLWDYPVAVTNADMASLRNSAEQAERTGAMLLVSLTGDDPICREPGAFDSLRPHIEQDHWIPFHRLRKDPAARAVAVVTPSVVIDSRDKPPVQVGGAWLCLFSLVDQILRSPSSFPSTVRLAGSGIETLADAPLRHARGVDTAHVAEAAGFGLTLLSRHSATPGGTAIKTLIDTDIAAELYGSFGYNLLLNRLVRAAAAGVAQCPAEANTEERAVEAGMPVLELLAQYRLIENQEEVEVALDEQDKIQVTVASSKEPFGEPLRVQFTMA